MSAAKKLNLISEADYLASELEAVIKHEYLGGVVYAMAGARNRHNRIVVNILGTLFAGLKGRPCRPCDSDTKIRIRMPGHTRFYYPDASVVCQLNPETDSFEDQPGAVFEVLSPATRRIDEGEKKDGYLSIPSLSVYALVEQSRPAITVFRRTVHGFVSEVYEGTDAVVPLPEVGTDLPLADVYAGLKFPPEAGEREEGSAE